MVTGTSSSKLVQEYRKTDLSNDDARGLYVGIIQAADTQEVAIAFSAKVGK